MRDSTLHCSTAVAGANDRPASLASHVWAALAATIVLGVIVCGAYPLAVWAIAQAAFPHQANGSLVRPGGAGAAAGSALLSQPFAGRQYFHPRPSSAGAGHDGANSGGSNLGPLSDKLINGLVQTDGNGVETLAFDGVRLRTLRYALENGIQFRSSLPLDGFRGKDGALDEVRVVKAFPHRGGPADKQPLVLHGFSTLIPGDAVTASGSGLDPHISPANARIQKARVARARGVTVEAVEALIERHTSGPDLGVLGEPGVNVLLVNLHLDTLHPVAAPK